MSDHSHGPWRGRYFGGKWCVLHKGGDNTTILAVCEGDEAEANARVMAASEEMLEALLTARDHVSPVFNPVILAKIDGAIAKAFSRGGGKPAAGDKGEREP